MCVFESVALPTAVEYLFPEIRMGTLWHVAGAPVHLGFVVLGVAGSVVMTWINVIGIRTAAFVQSAITGAILLAGLLLLAGAGANGAWQNAEPLVAVPVTGVLTVAHHGPRPHGGVRRPCRSPRRRSTCRRSGSGGSSSGRS